jgi:hypothetical protein
MTDMKLKSKKTPPAKRIRRPDDLVPVRANVLHRDRIAARQLAISASMNVDDFYGVLVDLALDRIRSESLTWQGVLAAFPREVKNGLP